jgi:hypothetical protein
MTQDEIIELAEQAGMTRDGDMWFSNGKTDMDVEHKHLEAFAKLVAEREREACAKLIESHGQTLANGFMLTEAIRARGQA